MNFNKFHEHVFLIYIHKNYDQINFYIENKIHEITYAFTTILNKLLVHF